MSRVQQLRAVVKQRLTAAVEEIFGLFDRTMEEYEEEIDRQRRLLEGVLKPVYIHINKADDPQLLLSEEEVSPEQQEWIPSLDQEDPEPPHIKEEQEELWTSQEGEQLQGAEEADIIEFPSTAVSVKSEDDDEEPQSSQLYQSHNEENREAEPLSSSSTEQMKTEANAKDCGVSEPARNVDPADHSQPTCDGKTSHSSEPEPEDSDDDWMETREPQSGLDSLKNSEVLISHKTSSIGEAHFSSTYGKTFLQKSHMQKHMRSHEGNKPFVCPVCGKIFSQSETLHSHMIIHTGERPFSCSVCKEKFKQRSTLKKHMRVHTGEKPFSCSTCGRRFGDKGSLKRHLMIHTGEKPYSCSVCGKIFRYRSQVKRHKCLGPPGGAADDSLATNTRAAGSRPLLPPAWSGVHTGTIGRTWEAGQEYVPWSLH